MDLETGSLIHVNGLIDALLAPVTKNSAFLLKVPGTADKAVTGQETNRRGSEIGSRILISQTI
jgi:hypothetical protein